MSAYVKLTGVSTYRNYMIGHFVTPVTEYYKFRRANVSDLWCVCEFFSEASARDCIDAIENSK